MLTDPIKFYEYFKIAHTQLQGATKSTNGQNDKNSKKESSSQQSAENEPKKRLTDYDDLTIFYLTMPHHLLEGKELKYEEFIQQLKECKITP